MLFNISKVTPPLNNKYVVKDLDPKRKNQKEQSVTSQSASGHNLRHFVSPRSERSTLQNLKK